MAQSNIINRYGANSILLNGIQLHTIYVRWNVTPITTKVLGGLNSVCRVKDKYILSLVTEDYDMHKRNIKLLNEHSYKIKKMQLDNKYNK